MPHFVFYFDRIIYIIIQICNNPIEGIGDYNTLKGEKKKIVRTVIISGLILGTLYGIVANLYDGVDDSIKVENKVGHIPLQ
jgi:xanthine/uracil permease